MARSLRACRGRRPSGWTALVPVVALAAGLLFATSGRTAQGTDLRAGDVTELSELIAQRETAIARQAGQLADLQRQVQRLTAQAATRDGAVAAAQSAGDAGALSGGPGAAHRAGRGHHPGRRPARPDGSLPVNARPDDLVIHQSDVQAVVNAVWAAAADGVAIMDQRLIATSAVRCVGNTLLLQGRTYSPPFVITAIGDAARDPRPAGGLAAGRGPPAGGGRLRPDLLRARAPRGHPARLRRPARTCSTPRAR